MLKAVLRNENFREHLKKKEIFWLLGTFAFSAILALLLFGPEAFEAGSTRSLNVYDTYYVISTVHLTLLILLLILFVIYLIRSIIKGFKNLTANLILTISTVLLIVILTGIS